MKPKLDLSAIEARANAATPGEWTYSDGNPDWYYVEKDGNPFVMMTPLIDNRSPDPIRKNRRNNAAFIAAARTDVPALTRYARELEAENATMKAALVELSDWYECGCIARRALRKDGDQYV